MLSVNLTRMVDATHVLGLCGSLRKASSNLTLLQAARALAGNGITFAIAAPLDRVPHFNPDLDDDAPPEAVTAWRAEMAEAGSVLICSPEYAFGIPGVLKNALDWLVSSGELYEKPVGVITASPNYGGATHARDHLLDTLRAQNAALIPGAQISIPFVRKRFDEQGNLIDPDLATALRMSLEVLAHASRERAFSS